MRLTAWGVAATAVLATSPLLALTYLWVGPQMVGGAVRQGGWSFAGFGLLLFLQAWVFLALLGTTPGVAAGRSRSAAWALVLLVVAVATSWTRIGATTGVSAWLPAGRLILTGVGLATAIGLAAVMRAESADRSSGSPMAGAIGVLLAVAFLGGAYLGWSSDAIPSTPLDLAIPAFESGSTASGPESAPTPPQHPRLAANPDSNIHHDAWMTDTYPDRPITDPASAEVASFLAMGDCATVTFDAVGRLATVCVGVTESIAWLLDPTDLSPIDSRRLAERPFRPDFATNFSGGGYAVLTADQQLLVPTSAGEVLVLPVEEAGFGPTQSVDLGSALGETEPITSVLPDASGRWWFAGRDGTLGLYDPASDRSETIELGAGIENSFAVGTDGGAYVVTDAGLVAVIDDAGTPRVRWEAAYDQGTRQKPGQTSRGSGTTPTVFDDGRLVAITDNAEPRMQVVVYRTSDGSEVCTARVFGSGTSATENTLVALGTSLFVENNYGYRLFGSGNGGTSEPGVARIDVDADRGLCDVAWQNDDVHVPSVVSKVSAADGLFLTYTKDPSPLGVDAWWFTAIDTRSGEVVWRRLAGTGPLVNNHYAGLYVGPDGSIYVGAVGGVVGLLAG